MVFTDVLAAPNALIEVVTPSADAPEKKKKEEKPTMSLRELDVNIATKVVDATPATNPPVPLLKRSVMSESRVPQKLKEKSTLVPMEGRENSLPNFASSTGRRLRSSPLEH
jgi:hypothetical protein